MILVMDSKQLIRQLRKAGFIRVRQKGSHVVFEHPDGRKVTTVSPQRHVPIGLLKYIEKKTGLKLR